VHEGQAWLGGHLQQLHAVHGAAPRRHRHTEVPEDVGGQDLLGGDLAAGQVLHPGGAVVEPLVEVQLLAHQLLHQVAAEADGSVVGDAEVTHGEAEARRRAAEVLGVRGALDRPVRHGVGVQLDELLEGGAMAQGRHHPGVHPLAAVLQEALGRVGQHLARRAEQVRHPAVGAGAGAVDHQGRGHPGVVELQSGERPGHLGRGFGAAGHDVVDAWHRFLGEHGPAGLLPDDAGHVELPPRLHEEEEAVGPVDAAR